MIKSLASLVLQVADVDRSSRFYQDLGFLESKADGNSREVRMNWFKVRFEPADGATTGGAGIQIGLSVDDLAEMRQKLDELGARPTDATGRGGLLASDPDGYQLLLFQAK
jgi:catechol 2,3-dioxygenase-like lactoylglutathione lyase family enzyme